MTVPQIIELMVGRAMTEAYPFRPSVELGSELLTVEDLSYRGNLEPVSLQLHAGEILGVAGRVGSLEPGKDADLALYRAKAMGRNRLVLFEPSIEEKSLPALRG